MASKDVSGRFERYSNSEKIEFDPAPARPETGSPRRNGSTPIDEPF